VRKILFLVLVSLATVAALGAVKHRYNFQLSPSVHPFVAEYKAATTHLHQAQSQAVVDNDRFLTMAVRSDGAVMTANTLPDTEGRLETVRSIALKDRYVVIDPFSNSISTYKSYTPTIAATQDCRGVRDIQVLGHQTEIVSDNANPNVHYPQEGVTKWLAVDLNCIPLRERYVKDDGSELVHVNRDAISVQVGEPPTAYFDIPTTYMERGPADIDSERQKKTGRHVWGDPTVLQKLQQVYDGSK
jgi:hypothetical protein